MSQTCLTGIGVISASGIGKEEFWHSLFKAEDVVSKILSFDTQEFKTKVAAEVKDFKPEVLLKGKSLRNLDKNALLLASAVKLAIDDSGIVIDDKNTDSVGIATGTTFSHLWSVLEFDKEVFIEGINFASPSLFPSTVLNAASSQAAILFNIQGFNTTISSGYASSLSALRYAVDAIDSSKAEIVYANGVESLTHSLFFAFQKLGYMAGIQGIALSCPFDKRRNGPILGEASVSLCVEDLDKAKKRKANILAKVKAISCYFDAFRMGRINPNGEGLERAIKEVFDKSGISLSDIDYISSCANSSSDLDRIEVSVLSKIFGKSLKNIPISSIKSMLGETFSASAGLQIASCVGAMKKSLLPPTINYKELDLDCDIDCVAGSVRKKKVKTALVLSLGPGGYSGACILEDYNDKLAS